MLFELLSARIKHTRKIQEKIKNPEASHTTFKVRFQRIRLNMVYQELEVAYLRILFKAGCKNKNQFLYMQAMK